MSTDILRNRYHHMLRPLKSIDNAARVLCTERIISAEEEREILDKLSEETKSASLCDVLVGKGISSLVQVASILDCEQKRDAGGDFALASSSSTSSANSTSSSSSSTVSQCEEFQGGGEGGGGGGYDEVISGRHQGFGQHGILPGTEKQPIHDKEKQSPEVLLPPRVGKSEVLSLEEPAASATSKSLRGMEDAFIVLFFTFITQQLQYLWRPQNGFHHHHQGHTHNRSTQHDDDGDHYYHPHGNNNSSSNGAEATPTPTTPTSSIAAMFPWLKVDVPPNEAREYFPAELVKSVLPSAGSPASLRLSVILEAFRQFVASTDALKSENQSLQRKVRGHDDLLRRFRALEAKMVEMQASQQAATAPATVTAAAWKQLQQQLQQQRQHIAALEEQAKQVLPLREAYLRSEERCKQLVEVTQQWALECDSKLKVIGVLEVEVGQLKGTVQQLEGRVNKYKKYWLETKDLVPARPGGGVDEQFEEMRSELAMRRELYDQVMSERDEAMKKVKALVSEIEALRDHNVQLEDRAANFKIQAQAKEPSVREMSLLLEQNGQLQSKIEALRKEKAELLDKTVALGILVEDLTAKTTFDDQRPLKPQSSRRDAMVIGYNPSVRPTPTPPSQFLAPPPSTSNSIHQHQHQHHRTHHQGPQGTIECDENDDVLSLESSNAGSGSFSSSSHHSQSRSSERRPQQQHHIAATSRSNDRDDDSNSTSSSQQQHQLSHWMASQLKTRDSATATTSSATSSPSSSSPASSPPFDVAPPPLAADTTTTATEDYVSRIRYPNSSQIQIQPLLDEDISLKTAGDQILPENPPSRSRATTKEPLYCDRSRFNIPPRPRRQVEAAPPPNQPTAILTPDSAFFHPTTKERTCPVCCHTFLTLSEPEFEAHVAVCYK